MTYIERAIVHMHYKYTVHIYIYIYIYIQTNYVPTAIILSTWLLYVELSQFEHCTISLCQIADIPKQTKCLGRMSDDPNKDISPLLFPSPLNKSHVPCSIEIIYCLKRLKMHI